MQSAIVIMVLGDRVYENVDMYTDMDSDMWLMVA